MAGRSLWSVLMVAWLSASNAAALPLPDSATGTVPAAEQERDGDIQGLYRPEGFDSGAVDEAAAPEAPDDSGAAS